MVQMMRLRSRKGVAMGGGTDIANFAADMVLADSNFATTEKDAEEGRLIPNNDAKPFIGVLSRLDLLQCAPRLPATTLG
ncbi:hypothetical protein HYPSUDRAFT_207661 [Hypholoma sublateritium FD-334 SS-4]|uniref:Uncharacterized protein n=1 Tax=Hypholoma sublateritium (strain FD-334 SS-4) TaxID=945553 RepID=A0A0D2KMD2_HYPSF|nr:hypothetical protein HYPSUDRAFT_207661 [Hypholoma sublateritium FD-334 SS-4]